MSSIRATHQLTRTLPRSALHTSPHSQQYRNFRHSATATLLAARPTVVRRYCYTTCLTKSSAQLHTPPPTARQLHTSSVTSAATSTHSSLSAGVSNKEQPTTIPKVADHSLTSDTYTANPTDHAAAKAVNAAHSSTTSAPSPHSATATMSSASPVASSSFSTTGFDRLPTELPKNSFAYYKEIAIICLVFAITGSTAVYIIKPLIPMLTGINGSLFKGPISYQLLYVLCLTPSYSVMLFIFSRLFGRKRFFNAMLTRMWGRFIGKRNAQKLFGAPTTQNKPVVTAAAQKQR